MSDLFIRFIAFLVAMSVALAIYFLGQPLVNPDEGYPGPHTCEEDEAQYVTPDGLACIPVDDTNIEAVAR